MYLAIVPARAGSKRIPGKNLVLLHGVPLIDYTLRAAASARRLGAVVVSTDSDAIAEHARRFGALVPQLRPAALAGDRSPVAQALLHALFSYEQAGGARADAVVVLQPTSPLRSAEDIDRAIELFEASGADTVTAVRPARAHPYHAWRREGDAIVPLFSAEHVTMDRQALPEVRMENGAVYVIRRELVLQQRIYGSRVIPYEMDLMSSVDIDDPLDLAWAEFLLGRRFGGNGLSDA
jgi:CMP-N-acetylneuraminic acid synthetase